MIVALLLVVVVVVLAAGDDGGSMCRCRALGWYSRCELEAGGGVPRCVSNLTESLLLDAKGAKVLDGRSLALTPRLTNLKVLNLPYRDLDEDLFGDVRGLLYLDLSSNLLSHVGAAAFSRVSCNWLSLDDNRLRGLADGAFQNVTSLALHDNLLTSLRTQVFLPHSQVRVLNLARNRLRTLPRGLLEALPTLQEIHLQGNPWRCDCALLAEVLGLQRVLRSSAQCHDPPSLRGVALLDLPQRLNCDEPS